MGIHHPARSQSYMDFPRPSIQEDTRQRVLCRGPSTNVCLVHTSVGDNAAQLSTNKAHQGLATQPKTIAIQTELSKSSEPTAIETMIKADMSIDSSLESLNTLQVKSLNEGGGDSLSFEPPVTRDSLSELDLVRIMHDPKLRHDLNFEREITFRPNPDAEKQKEKAAQTYWDAMTIEFATFIHRRSQPATKLECQNHSAESTSQRHKKRIACREIPRRLPGMLKGIREILKTLVPETEWSSVDERLDIELLMQELENGVCNIKGLGDWLGTLLLGSCSPLRDSSIGQMVSEIREGAQKNDPGVLVKALKMLLGVLEMMKLVGSLSD